MANVDAQYVIDIAAQMDGGEATIDELDRLTAALTGSGKNADFFQSAIKQVSAEMSAAAQASAAASSALASGQEEYSNLERAALQANKAVERAAVAGGTMSREYLQAAQKANEANTAVGAYAVTLGKLEKDSADAAKEEAKLAQTFDNVKKLSGHADKSIQQQSEKLEKLAGTFGSIGGPVGQLGQSILKPIQGFTKLSGAMGDAGAAAVVGAVGFAAAAVGIAAVTAAAVAGVASIAQWAIGLADVNRSADLSKEAFNAANPAIAQYSDLIDDLSAELQLSRKQVVGLEKDLKAAGVVTKDMPKALEAAALAEKALSDQGGAAEFIKQIKEGKLAVNQFATNAQSKFGNIVARQLLSLESQSVRFKSEISGLFGELDIEPALRGLDKLVGLFDENSESGKALKFLFETIFQPLIDNAEDAATAVEAFALGFEIGLMKLYIALKPAIKVIAELFGLDDSDLQSLFEGLTDAGEIAAYVFVGFAAVVGVLVAVFASLAAGAAIVFAGIMALPAAMQAAGEAAGKWLGHAVSEAINYITSIDWAGTGQAIIDGLVNGITGAASRLVSAITGAVGGAIAAAKNMLGIASPSKVFEGFGDMTGAGFVQGVEAQNDNAQAAMSDMVEPELPAQPFAGVTSASTGGPGAAEPAAPAAAAGDSGGSITINLQGAQLTFSGLKDAPQGVEQFAEMLTKIMKGDAAAMGKTAEEKAAA